MKNPRIMIFSASFGAGHVRAAEALIEAIRQSCPYAEVCHLDCWAIVSKHLNSLTKNFYIGMLKHTPNLWGGFYYGTAKISSDSILQRFLDNAGLRTYLDRINLFKPDLIVCTYPTVAGAIALLRKQKAIDVPVAVVITDYTVHNQWIHDGVDLYIVGSADIYNDFVARGIDPDKVKFTGIPVSPRFENDLNRDQIRDRLGLLPDRPTCLIMGGAYGVLSELKKLCITLAQTPVPAQSIVVCGRDQHLYKSLENVMTNTRNPMARFGFVSNVEELMSAADIIITKAGGLTISEALTKGLPILIYKPIPGQEQENTAFVQKIGAGKAAHSQPQLEELLLSLLDHPQELHTMARAAAQALPGHAAAEAIQHMFSLINYS